MKNKTWIILIAVVSVLAILSLRPLPATDEKDCLIAKGTVIEITEGGIRDIVFKLKEHDRRYYINRGLEMGFSLEKLKAELINEEVTIKYPDFWTFLDPFNSIAHISKMEHNGQVIYTEMP